MKHLRPHLLAAPAQDRARPRLLLLLLLFALPQPAVSEERNAHPGAERVERMLHELRENAELDPIPRRTYRVVEADLNAYLALRLAQTPHAGLEQISVRLKAETFLTRVIVDMDQVKLPEDALSTSLLRSLIRGRQILEAEGVLETGDGAGRYHLRQAWLNGVPVPAALVETILSSLGARQEPPFDPTEPFDLPFGIQSIQVSPAEATLQTGE